MTGPNLDPARMRFPADRAAFVYQGPNQPILTPPTTGLKVYSNESGTTLANITDLNGTVIGDSKIFTGSDGLLPEFYGPQGAVARLWVRSEGSNRVYPLDARVIDQFGRVAQLLVGDMPPEDSMGAYGSMYLEKPAQLLYGPKTNTWPRPGVSIRGVPGPAGGTEEFLQVSPQTVWTIEHDLTYDPHVTIIDSAGSMVLGDVRYPSAGTITVTFSAPFAGKALLS